MKCEELIARAGRVEVFVPTAVELIAIGFETGSNRSATTGAFTAGLSARNCASISAKPIRSRCRSFASLIGWPLMVVPFVEFRSFKNAWPFFWLMRACIKETESSSITIVFPFIRPTEGEHDCNRGRLSFFDARPHQPEKRPGVFEGPEFDKRNNHQRPANQRSETATPRSNWLC